MITSPTEAQLLFDRLKEDSKPLRIKLKSSSLVFDGVGTVIDFNPSTLQLGGPVWQFTVPLGGASFVFSDPREVQITSVRESESAKYEQGISVTLANGDELVLLELKGPPGKTTDETDE